MTVELFSVRECGLCEQALGLLGSLEREFHFDLKETLLDEEHPRYKEMVLEVPVVIVNGRHRLAGVIEEVALRSALKEERPPTRLFHIGKFLEALGFLTVAVGLMYGLAGDMWTDLWFFLAGILVFAVGRTLEKREMRKDRFPTRGDDHLVTG